MPEIKGFKGIFYNTSNVGDVSKVIAPPYDVISSAEQEKLYSRDDHNYVRIILGKTSPKDTETDNRYTRSANTLKTWLEQRVLTEDEAPSIYIYEQQFQFNKKKYSRKGFLGLIKLDRTGDGVKAHENTYAGPKADRLALLKACRTNTEPIFMVYDGSEIDDPEGQPLISTKDDNGVTHRIYRADSHVSASFLNSLKEKSFYIADGHHRYETSVNYAREAKIDPDSSDSQNYILTYFVEAHDKGLLVLPIHRLLNISEEDIDFILKNAKKYFLIVEISSFEKVQKSNGHVFGFYHKKDNKLYMLKLRDLTAKDKVMQEKGRQDLASLDVSILHSLLLDEILTKYKDKKTEEVIGYSHDDADAISQVKKGNYTCAFLMNPTKVDEIMSIADVGGKMPQKSTFFYPKPYSGLMLRRF